jgi:hypothetical protein
VWERAAPSRAAHSQRAPRAPAGPGCRRPRNEHAVARHLGQEVAVVVALPLQLEASLRDERGQGELFWLVRLARLLRRRFGERARELRELNRKLARWPSRRPSGETLAAPAIVESGRKRHAFCLFYRRLRGRGKRQALGLDLYDDGVRELGRCGGGGGGVGGVVAECGVGGRWSSFCVLCCVSLLASSAQGASLTLPAGTSPYIQSSPMYVCTSP